MSRTTDDSNDPDLTRGADPADGQRVPQAPAYLVLSEAERAKGFVRPVRRSYMHVTCGAVTTMGQAIAETYAREPGFYGSTYCTKCGQHRPVGDFRWDPDGSVVGS
jgi:hypothetical protein